MRDNLDIEVGIPYLASRGKQDMTVEAKWRLYEQDKLSLGLMPGISLPTGNEARGLGTGKTTWGSLLLLSYELENWSFHTNAGYRHNRNAQGDRESLLHYSASLWFKAAGDLTLVSDLSWDTNPDRTSNTSLRYVILGAIYEVTKSFDVDIGLRRGNSPAIDRALMAGVTLRW